MGQLRGQWGLWHIVHQQIAFVRAFLFFSNATNCGFSEIFFLTPMLALKNYLGQDRCVPPSSLQLQHKYTPRSM